jgi:fumarate hydratase subunit beta
MRLRAPISESSARSLRLGDEVFVDGTVFIGRDEVHLRALELHRRGESIPVDMRDGMLFHCGPIVKKEGDSWKVIAAGPTTSSRMNALEPEFIKAFGVRAIIGKGGMSAPTVQAMKERGCVYLAYPGGAAVLAASGIERVERVEWLDLGMPEALWVVEAKDLGPLTVAIDAHGRSLYEKIDAQVEANLPSVRKKLGL